MNTAQDDAVMAGVSGTQTVAAADGRTLTIAEWGDRDGFPVFFLHGRPGSRFVGQAYTGAYANVGARVITYDRPGYGGSDRFRGRRVVDSVADVSAIADSNDRMTTATRSTRSAGLLSGYGECGWIARQRRLPPA